ncbi:hypothetical protein NLU13_6792 [Sarocladium strictum]|uniref:Phospholipase/carboxylesterase/thioesterase domain-containing protein n=1 Tax=Sarocladium strictum TaxID=5046 RepID=A0AA39GE14_SARSR|nr:hypothetical protein NLU13_6792 [Sarocladium strictum]
MSTEPSSPFGHVHVVEPTATHTHTAIFLHGRGGTGVEFFEELEETTMTSKKSLVQTLPGWRWVFPSSRELWNPVFKESIPAWFEAYSLTDITARQDLQTDGIREAVEYLTRICESEVKRLDGLASNVVLGGISQGGAIGLWTMLSLRSNAPLKCPTTFVGASTWLPFASDIEAVLDPEQDDPKDSLGTEFVKAMIGPIDQTQKPILTFLGHGIDDAYVDVELGRQARDVLSRAGFITEWKEYSGAEQEGHWIKAPEEMDDIARFLQRIEMGESERADRVV